MNLSGGIIPPLVTPLLDQEKLDEAGLERLIEHVIAGGVHGLFALGSTGEGPSLSRRLRGEVVRSVSRWAAGRLPVLVGIGDTSFAESVGLARASAEAGASAVVVTPPYYLTYSQEELLRYIERLASESPLPVFLYNIPHLTKVNFTAGTVSRCVDIENVAGFKDSSFDLIYLAEVIRLTRRREGFQVYCGPEELLLPAMLMGAAGGVNGGSNYCPALFTRLYEAIRRHHYEDAACLQERVQRIAKALYSVGDAASSYTRGMKAALAHLGICPDLPAWPLLPFAPAEKAEFAARFGEVRELWS